MFSILQVGGFAYRTDAGGAVAQRDEPEPAVIEPEQADIAFRITGQALRSGEMPVECGAGVARIALLRAESPGEKGVAPGSVDDVARTPTLFDFQG